MSGYSIEPAAASQAIEQLEQILEELRAEIGRLSSVENDLLSDANWQGPNKQSFRSDFSAYLTAVAKLHDNGVEHLEALRGIAASYIENER